MSDDATLLRRYADERAEDAFAELVTRHVNLVYSVALRRTGGDAHLAADVVQCVFVALARRASSLSRHVVLTGWLYSTARNIAVDTVRAVQRRQRREREAYTMQEINAAGGPQAEWEQLRPVLDDAMDDLNPRDREAVLLRFYDGRAFAEIGHALQVSEDAARMRVERALGKLHALLARRGLTSTNAALALVMSKQAVFAAPAGLAANVAASAFASKVGAAGTMVTFFHVVAQTKVMLVAAAALVLLAAGFVTREMAAREAAERTLLAARLDYENMVANVHTTEARARRAELEAAALLRSSDVVPGTPAAPAPRGSAEGDPHSAAAAADALMARHPAVKQALLDWYSAKIRFAFAPFFQSRALNSDQIERFVGLLRNDLFFGEWGPNGQFLEFHLPREVPDEQIPGALKELLGETGYRDYFAFKRVSGAREFAAQIATHLCLTDTPLIPQQADALVKIFAETPRRHDSEGSAAFWGDVITGAHAHLSPPQIAVLRGISDHDQKSALAIEAQRTAAARQMP